MKTNFNFISPRINGLAKHMIDKKMRAMVNPVTSNIVINHAGKVFEIESITSETPSCPCILGQNDFIYTNGELTSNQINVLSFSYSIDCAWSIVNAYVDIEGNVGFGSFEAGWRVAYNSLDWTEYILITFQFDPETGMINVTVYWDCVDPIVITVTVIWNGQIGEEICEVIQTFKFTLGGGS